MLNGPAKSRLRVCWRAWVNSANDIHRPPEMRAMYLMETSIAILMNISGDGDYA